MAKQNGSNRSTQSQQPAASSRGRSGGKSKSAGGGGGQGSSGGTQRRRTTSSSSRGTAAAGKGGGSQAQRQPAQQSRSAKRGAIAGAGAKVVGTVRENPVPAALVGAAVAWLLVQNRSRLPIAMPHMPESLTGIAESAREAFAGTAQSTRKALRGGVGTAAGSVKGGAVTVAESVKGGAVTVGEYAKTGAVTVGEYAKNGATKVGDVAKKGFQRSREAVTDTWDTHPLAVGLGLLAAGVAAGMMMPAPKDAAITKAARRLTERVASRGEELLDSARQYVTSSARAASREAKRQGLTPDQLARKAKRVADAATP